MSNDLKVNGIEWMSQMFLNSWSNFNLLMVWPPIILF